MRVLVIGEDSAASQVAGMLKRCGHDVQIAASAHVASLQAPAIKPDVVFVNATLAAPNGLSVVHHLRQTAALIGTPLIAVSSTVEAPGESIGEGFDDVVWAPYHLEDISAVMSRIRDKIAVSCERLARAYQQSIHSRERINACRVSLAEYRRNRPALRSTARPLVSLLGCGEDVREMIASLPADGADIAIVRSTADFLKARQLEPQPRRDCLVVDATQQGIDAVAAISELAGARPYLPVIALVEAGDVTRAVKLMHAGAHDVIEKPPEEHSLAEAISLALEVPDFDRDGSTADIGTAARSFPLSEADRRLLHLTAAGKLNKQIARELGVSLRTVHIRRAALMRKLGAGTRIELIRIAVGAGLC
ncbi:MAG TPA: response regulator [Pirellulales bacterium]|nr:response regulator [Pirellulales bacterium]